MKKLFNLSMAIFLIVISIPVTAQVTTRLRGSEMQREKFFVEILDFSSGTEDSTLVNVFVQVPYNEVQFFKTGDNFTANYSVTLALMDEDKENLISEKTWNEKIVSKNFSETTSRKNFNLSLRSFTLKPDDYFLRISVEDQNSKNTFVVNRELEVREFSDKLDISDIMLISSQTKVGNDSKIIPNVSRNIYAGKSGIPLYYEIYSAAKGKARIIYSINDRKRRKCF